MNFHVTNDSNLQNQFWISLQPAEITTFKKRTMDRISNHSCLGGPLSPTPDHSQSEIQSETPIATTMGRDVIVRDKNKLSLLLNLPFEIQSKIYSHLQTRDIANLIRANSYMNKTLKNDNSMARAWYRRFASSRQALIKTIVTEKDKDQFGNWLSRFTMDKALVKSVMDRHGSIDFPALFSFTLTKLMIECKTFIFETKASLLNNGRMNSATLSADGHYLVSVSDSKTVIIFGRETDGSWQAKGTITHDGRVTSFMLSNDGHYVVTTSEDCKARIYGKKDERSWEEKAIISHDKPVMSATFSANDRYLVTASHDGKAKVYGLEDDESWAEKAIISHDFLTSATFSDDSRYVVTTSLDHTAKIYGKMNDGSWIVKAIISHDNSVWSAKFSADSRHIITCCEGNRMKICGLEDDGTWEEKTIFSNEDRFYSATFSADSRHMVTSGQDGRAIIYGQEDGSWNEKATISHDDRIYSTTFSPDNRCVITRSADNKAKIYGLNDNGSWEERATISHRMPIISATFSADSRHVMTHGEDRKVKIYGRKGNGSWEEKTTISSGYYIRSASFSVDGSHLVTANNDNASESIYHQFRNTFFSLLAPLDFHLAIVYGQVSDGSWKKKATISYPRGIVSATFSVDGYVLTIHEDQSAKITELRMDE